MDQRNRIYLASCLGAVALAAVPGCGSLTPRNFRAMNNPAPVVRAGAVGLGDDQPDAVAIPAWIVSLDDPNEVVRMAADAALKRRTGQDFGYVPWDEPEARAPAVARWKAWWAAQGNGRGSAPAQGGVASRRRKG